VLRVGAPVVLACAVRLMAIALVPGWGRDASAPGDARDYHHPALNLSSGRRYGLAWEGGGALHGQLRPTAKRAPLWPVLLAGLYRGVGPSPAAGRALLVGLDALVCLGNPYGWDPGIWRGANEVAVPAWWLVAVVGGVGVWRLRDRLRPWYPALLTFGALAVSAILLGGTSRLRTPSDPIVVLLAAVGVAGHRSA